MWLFRNFITKSLSLWTLRRVSHVIVKSQNLYERIADRTGAAISIIANGVDVSVFDINKNRDEYRVEKGWAEDDFVILFNLRRGDSKLEKVKNYPLAKEVFEVLQSRVQKKIHLELISGKTHLEMNQLFNAADCLLLTSLHEGSPNIVKEAMACNLPIVSVNCGDVKERLSSVNNSFVSKDYCPKELASYCEKLVAGKLRSNGREILINQGLDSESVAKNLLTIFKSIN
jgi:glycosyltransferase involved in cell wall biosynthesis